MSDRLQLAFGAHIEPLGDVAFVQGKGEGSARLLYLSRADVVVQVNDVIVHPIAQLIMHFADLLIYRDYLVEVGVVFEQGRKLAFRNEIDLYLAFQLCFQSAYDRRSQDYVSNGAETYDEDSSRLGH